MWAVRPDALAGMLAEYRHWTPLPLQVEAFDGVLQARAAARAPRISGAIQIIPVAGLIRQRSSGGLFDVLFGGSTTQGIGAAIDEALANDAIGGIVLDVSSPGGEVYGLTELAAKIRDARGQKPIVGVANAEAASAAYYLLSQTSPAYVTPSGMVGSVGTITAHLDASGFDEKIGMETEYIFAGKYKAELWQNKLTDEARAALQATVDRYYGQFVADVAKGRGTTAKSVEANYGQGRMLVADDALAAGMVDGIATLDEVIGRMTAEQKRKQQARAVRSHAEATLKIAGIDS
jgi:signal peptide peptidase SppA